MFARIKLRWRQASLAREGNRMSKRKLRWPEGLLRLASLGRWGGHERFTGRSTPAFPSPSFEGSVLGKQVRFPVYNVLLHFCFASFPGRFTPNSAPTRRLKKI